MSASRQLVRPGRSGSVYLIALAVAVAVATIAVVLARGVVVHLRAADRNMARTQCRAAAMGVVRAVVADLAASTADGGTPILRSVDPAGAVVGDCTVLLIGRDPIGQAVRFGLIADAGRIGVNALADPRVPAVVRSTCATALAGLPGMTTAIVAALRDWVDADDAPDPDGGAERTDGTYLGAAVPYGPRNGPMETLDEVRMVRDVTDALYFGGDANGNGRLDPGEQDAGDGTPRPGLQDVLCLESREPGIAADGSVRVPIVTGGTRSRVNPALSGQLATWFGAQRGAEVWRAVGQAGATPFANRLELLQSVADLLSDDEMTQLWNRLSGPEGRVGLVDAWSCPHHLLAGLVGDALAATITAARPATPPNGPAWLVRTLDRSQARRWGMILTSGSWRFHADVLAVRNDGAGWVRLEAAIDCSGGTAVLTGLRPADGRGWPLPWCPPDRLRRRDPDQDPIPLLTTPTE